MKHYEWAALGSALEAFGDLRDAPDMPSGWVKTIRTAFDISASELANKLGITRQSVVALEKRENDGSITLATLRKAAKAMDMDLVFGFAPVERSLEEIKDPKRRQVARLIGLYQQSSIWMADGDTKQAMQSWAILDETATIMDNLASLIEYHRWAHEKIMPLLKDLTAGEWSRNVGGSFPTLKALYQHMLQADYRWLHRWKGVPKATTPKHYVVEGYESLLRLFRPQLLEMVSEASEILADEAGLGIHFITGTGLDVTQPFWQTLYQVVNHGTYHRGQVVNALRILGKQPVETDIFLFFREQATYADNQNI